MKVIHLKFNVQLNINASSPGLLKRSHQTKFPVCKYKIKFLYNKKSNLENNALINCLFKKATETKRGLWTMLKMYFCAFIQKAKVLKLKRINFNES